VTGAYALAFRRQNVYLLPDVYGVAMSGHLQWVDVANMYLQDQLVFLSGGTLIVGSGRGSDSASPDGGKVRWRCDA
jgi:hypothetical protein